MAEPWAPTDEEVRRAVVHGVRPGYTGPAMRSEGWDRWLAEHDARVLEDAADAWTQGGWADTPRHADRIADRMGASQFAGDWLRARARQALANARSTEGEEA